MTVDDDQVIGEQEQSQEEAEASFAAGFESVHGEVEAGSTAATLTDIGDASAGKSTQAGGDDPYEGMTPEMVKAQQARMRRMEGQLGDLKSKYDNLSALVKPTAAQQEERQTLLKNMAGIEQSLAEFGELKPIKDELEHITQSFDDLRQRVDSGINPDLIAEEVRKAVGTGIMDYVVPDWAEVSASKEFRQFMLIGGPSEEEYRDYALTLRDPATAASANQFVADWQEQYPTWWDDRGAKLFSDKPADSIQVLERFQAAKQSQQDRHQSQQQSVQRREQRLRGSLTPQGVSGDPTLGLSDEEAFNAGFRKASKK